jgi:hypothetical protein
VPESLAEHTGILPNRTCPAPEAAVAHRAGGRIASKKTFEFLSVRGTRVQADLVSVAVHDGESLAKLNSLSFRVEDEE